MCFNRFKAVARIEQWDDTEKLKELLPRLQGQAGEFVFGQLNDKQLFNFRSLCKELKHRFRKVETSRTYGAQFSNRAQNAGETVEEFAAQIKRLYDKAHPSRDRVTRGEDLLRKFLDGIQDEGARFQVEYVKEPEDIDEAVYEVVNFLETRKRVKSQDKNRKGGRAVNDQEGSNCEVTDGEAEQSGEEIRGVGHPRPKGSGKKPGAGRPYMGRDNQVKAATTGATTQSQPQASLEEQVQQMKTQLEQLTQELANRQGPTGDPPARPPVICYKCGTPGHYSRECWRFTANAQNQGTTPAQAGDNPSKTEAKAVTTVTTTASQATATSQPTASTNC